MMIIGFMRDLHLSKTKNIFLFDCQVGRLDLKTRRVYSRVLASFIRYAGDPLVPELKPDHVRAYIADLSASPRNPKRLLEKHYMIIRTWIRWLYAQKKATERTNEVAKSPPLRDLFSSSSGGVWQSLLRSVSQTASGDC